MQVLVGHSMTWHLLFHSPKSCTFHKWHYLYLYCAAIQLLGALHLHRAWLEICDHVACLHLEPATYTLLLHCSPLQPDSQADAHCSLSTPVKGKICSFISCVKVMIPHRYIRKIFSPSLFSCLAFLFLNLSLLKYSISSLFNTTCLPHVF